jgi:hypothetical protein
MADQYKNPIAPSDCDLSRLRKLATESSDPYFMERIVHNLLNRVECLEDELSQRYPREGDQ